MGVRRHPVVPAAILSDFVVRAIEIAAAINRGRRQNLDRSADLTYASLADAGLTGVRWSLSGTIWPPETDVKALLARS